MFNVLTKDLKRNIIKNYKTNRFIVWFLVINLVLIFTVITLVPSYLFINIEKKSLESENKTVIDDKSLKDFNKIKEEFKNNNLYLSFLVQEGNRLDISPVLEKIIEEKNNSVSFGELHFVRKNATTTTVSISGLSKDRKSLIDFADNLSVAFGNINLPVSNFTKEKDISFSFDFEVKI